MALEIFKSYFGIVSKDKILFVVFRVKLCSKKASRELICDYIGLF